VTLAATAEQLCDTYGLGVPLRTMTLVARGEQGLIWRLETTVGDFAVKQLVIRQQESALQHEIQLQDAAIRCPSFILPSTLRTTTGAVLAELGGWQVKVQTWVDIHPPDVGLDPQRVGQLLADLHRVGPPTAEPVHPWYTEPVGASQWQQYVEHLSRGGASIANDITQAVPRLLQLEALLATPTDLQICHRDLWADNVRSTPQGDLCVIDWDNSGAADPSHELAMVMWEFGLDDEARCRELFEGYRNAGGTATLTEPSEFTMLIAQFGHFYATALEVWMEPHPSQEDLAWSQGRLDELAARPLTLAAIDQMISAVTRSRRSAVAAQDRQDSQKLDVDEDERRG
jgi:Ser/Thr protein kinase RdoA (MazF antagonist)